MNILNFITDLSLLDIIILVLVIFVVVFLSFLTNSLMKKNKELRKELTKINNNKNNEEENIIKEQPETTEEVKEDILFEESDIFLEPKKEEDITEILEDLPEIEETGPYTKNVLKELSRRQTSPVNIGNDTVEMPKIKVTSYVKKEEQPENKVEDDNQKFIEEISKQMEDEIKPQTIELTDYERRQEEEAIISYQELLKTKDRTYRITDDEEIETFIDELKELRTNLK